MTAYDVGYKFLEIIEPYAGYMIGLVLLWLVTLLSDRSLVSLFRELVDEFGNLIERKGNAKSLNALGLLVMFAIILFLFHGRLGDLFLPKDGEHTPNLGLQGLYVFVVLIFGGFVLISISLGRHQR
jgi:hypothetical protein